jgi:phosphatidylglycerophosphate synthase
MKFNLADIPTLPNLISTAGVAMALHGSVAVDTPRGVAEASIGRVLDLVDGKVARATGQTSEFGAAVDATFDKLGMAAIVAGEYYHEVAPRPVLGAILVRNVINARATTVAVNKQPDEVMNSTRNGKRAIFFENVALGFYAFANLADERSPRAAKVMRGIAHTAGVLGIGYYGIPATKELIERTRK